MDTSKNMSSTFHKKCAVCEKVWNSRDKFINDPSIVFIGYQPNFRELKQGLFYFNHLACKNTLSIRTGNFSDLYKGEVFNKSKYNTEDCLGHCDVIDNISLCPLKCECAYVREIMQLLH